MRVFIPLHKGRIVEIVMENIDDILMNMREEIFDQLQNPDLSGILLESQFSYFEKIDKQKGGEKILIDIKNDKNIELNIKLNCEE